MQIDLPIFRSNERAIAEGLQNLGVNFESIKVDLSTKIELPSVSDDFIAIYGDKVWEYIGYLDKEGTVLRYFPDFPLYQYPYAVYRLDSKKLSQSFIHSALRSLSSETPSTRPSA